MSPSLLTLTFHDAGDFAASRHAIAWLTERGFSVGRMQSREPRGILLGSYDIQKWRNLSPADRSALHGILVGNMRTGPVTVNLFDTAPNEAKAAISDARHDDVGLSVVLPPEGWNAFWDRNKEALIEEIGDELHCHMLAEAGKLTVGGGASPLVLVKIARAA